VADVDALLIAPADDLELAVAPEPLPATAGPRWRRYRPLIAAGGLGLGLVLVLVGCLVLSDAAGVLRPVTVIVGLVALLAGLDSLLKIRIGEHAQTGLYLSVIWLGLVVAAALLANFIPVSEARDTSLVISEPALLRPEIFSSHPLGTDRQSLDILGGIIYGARVSLVVGLGAVTIGLVIGGFFGLLAGFYRRSTEAVINLFTDVLIAFPPLILLLALVAVLEPNVRNVTIGLAVLSIPIYVRLAKANTLQHAQRDFVLASRALGAKNGRIIFRELLPNVLPSLVSYAFVVVAVLIVAEASLSYLGLSIQRPEPTWGNMIAAGEDSFQRHPHLVLIPGAVLFLTVFALNRVGESARQLWDPRRRSR
jgi:peptide/nickel transport system permease protein